MKLTALNKSWAIYEYSEVNRECDTFSALRDLLQVRTYDQLVSFLEKHTCNTMFAIDPSSNDNTVFNGKYSDNVKGMNSIYLEGSLDNVIARHTDLDLLDELVINDLKGQRVYQLSLTELVDFQKTMRCLLKYAAVSLGATATKDMFLEFDTFDLFDEEWLSNYLGSDASKVKTIGFPQEFIGAQHDGLLDDYAFEHCGIFPYLNACSPEQHIAPLVFDVNKNHAYKFPLSCDGVIYSYEEGYSENSRDEIYYLTASYLPDTPIEQAKMLLSGRAVEALLELECVCYEQKQFSKPCVDQRELNMYTYVPSKGFISKDTLVPKWWVNELYQQAISLIVEGKVKLCPICKSPFLIKDYRGCKQKMVCSNSCKTKASNNRKELVLQYAALRLPVEEAIEKVGKEYARSVRKWYKEAEQFVSEKLEK